MDTPTLSPKLAQGHYPGTISRIPVDAHYPGTKTKFFWTVSAYNRFFQEKPGEPVKPYVVLEAIPTAYFFGLLVGITCTYTKQLTPVEEDDMNFVAREVEFALDKRKMERAAREDEERQVQAAAQAEQARLAFIGKKYEDRVKHMKSAPTLKERNDAEATLNGGDPEVLFGTKMEAFQAGYVKGYEMGKEGDK